MKTLLRPAARVALVSGLLMAAFNSAQAQLKVGDRPYSINKASVLELESDRQGLLLPRVQPGMLTTAPLSTAPDGMVVIVEDAAHQNQTLYLRKNGAWVKMATLDESNGNWSRLGNVVNDATDFIGSTNTASLIFKTDNNEVMRLSSTGNLGIGVNNPTAKIDVLGNGKITGDLLVSGIIEAATGKITGALEAGSLTVNNGVTLPGLTASTTMVDVLVIDPTTGTVNRRAMSPAAFNNAISSLNGATEATQSFAVGTTGTDFNVATLLGVHTFNIPTIGATGVTRGMLTKADWDKLQSSQKQIIAQAFSNTADAKGITIGGTDNNELTLHAADATNPGAVSTTAQTFGGAKTFQDKVTAGGGLEVNNASKLNGATEIGGALSLTNVNATAATGPYEFLIRGAGNVVERRQVDIAALENGVQKISDGVNNTTGPDVTFATGTTGTDFNVAVNSATKTVNFNLPDASGIAGSEVRGAVSTATQSFAGDKSFAKTVNVGATSVGNSTLQVSGSVAMAIRTMNATGGILDTDNTVLVDASGAAVTVTLPAAVTGRIYTIKKIGNGGIDKEVTIATTGGAKIEGGANYVIYNDWTFVTLQSDGTDWYIIRK